MTTNPTWKYQVDWNRDGDFLDANEDISQYVMAADWGLGFKRPFQPIADESTLTLTLRNTDKRFSPEGTAGPYYPNLTPMKPIRVQSVYAGGTVTHWTGWIDRITPSWNPYGELTAVLEASGPKRFLQQTRLRMALMQSVTADEVIDRVLRDVKTPVAGNAWALGIVGHSELGTTTYLTAGLPRSLEVGRETFPYVADDWDDIDAYRAIKSAVESEPGRLFFNREGTAVFWNRQHFLTAVDNQGTINATMQGMDYAFGEEIYNEVEVTVHPRTASASDEVLWTLGETITLQPEQERTITGQYTEQDSDARVAAISIVEPITITAPPKVQMVSIEKAARSAKLTFKNFNLNVARNITGITILGKKLTVYNPTTIKVHDVQSVFDNGPNQLTLDLPLMASELAGRSVAEYELGRRSTPRGEVRSLTLMAANAAQIIQQVNRKIGDRVRVVENQTLHDQDYFIVGEQHHVGEGSQVYHTTWMLERAESAQYWRLGQVGYSELGVTTRIAPF